MIVHTLHDVVKLREMFDLRILRPSSKFIY